MRETKRFCDLLDTEQKEFDLGTDKCPAWVYPNAGQIGYYRWNLPAEDYEPTGFRGFEVERRSVPGHEYGLDLDDGDREALIAYLKTL
mgnify:CR=1 FL=1